MSKKVLVALFASFFGFSIVSSSFANEVKTEQPKAEKAEKVENKGGKKHHKDAAKEAPAAKTEEAKTAQPAKAK
jgi:hypothetical protein